LEVCIGQGAGCIDRHHLGDRFGRDGQPVAGDDVTPRIDTREDDRDEDRPSTTGTVASARVGNNSSPRRLVSAVSFRMSRRILGL
jgi:hypothetical protein